MQKSSRFVLFAVLFLFVVGAAKADSLGDGRVGIQPAPPADPPPSCGSFQFSADGSGQFSTSCTVAGQLVTSITIAVPQSDSSQPGQPAGLQVFSSLLTNVTGNVPPGILSLPGVYTFLSQFDWSESCGTGSVLDVAIFQCTLAAPVEPTGTGDQQLLAFLTKIGAINDGDCDADDFVFGIPVGCDLNFSTSGDTQNQLFADSATLDVSTNGAPLDPFSAPEPGTLILLLGGLGGLPFLQRRRRALR